MEAGANVAMVKPGRGPAVDCLAQAKALAPAIAAAVPRIEADRELPPDLVDALHTSGLYRMLFPRSLGGHELPLPVYIQVIEEIAKADASAAWCLGQSSVCSTITASLDHAVAWEMFGKDQRAVLNWGPQGRTAKAIVADGGYRLTGRWPFASGSRHASWMAAHCTVYQADGETPLAGADGKPDRWPADVDRRGDRRPSAVVDEDDVGDSEDADDQHPGEIPGVRRVVAAPYVAHPAHRPRFPLGRRPGAERDGGRVRPLRQHLGRCRGCAMALARGADQLAGGGEALRRVLGDGAFDHRLHPPRQLGLRVALFASVGGDPGQRLVEDAAERVDVGGRADLLAAPLLGRHVLHRADDRCLAEHAAVAERLGWVVVSMQNDWETVFGTD